MAVPIISQVGGRKRRPRKALAIATALCLCAMHPGTGRFVADAAAGDQVSLFPSGDPRMAAAMSQARSDLAEFLAMAERPRPGQRSFAVQVAFATGDGETREYIWITPFIRRDDAFLGRVSNRPRAVPDLHAGQVVGFSEADIVDWSFVDETGRMRGNRTTCALLAQEGADAAAKFRRRFGLDCERNGL